MRRYHDTRLGQILDALFAANLKQVFGAIALNALETYAIATPWVHQDTTTISLYGADEAAAGTDARRPAYGHTKDGRPDLKQLLLSLGVSGDGGLPLRMGLCDGNTSDSLDVRHAIEESLVLGLDGVKGIVAGSKAYSQPTYFGVVSGTAGGAGHLGAADLYDPAGGESGLSLDQKSRSDQSGLA